MHYQVLRFLFYNTIPLPSYILGSKTLFSTICYALTQLTPW